MKNKNPLYEEIKEKRAPWHVKVEKSLRISPKYPRELVKELGIREKTLTPVLKRMKDWGKIKQLENGKYARCDYKPLEGLIEKVLECGFVSENFLDIPIDVIASKVGYPPDDKLFLKTLYKVLERKNLILRDTRYSTFLSRIHEDEAKNVSNNRAVFVDAMKNSMIERTDGKPMEKAERAKVLQSIKNGKKLEDGGIKIVDTRELAERTINAEIKKHKDESDRWKKETI